MAGQDWETIIFYDGVCGFCDRFVSFVARHDRRGTFYFAPLQGITAKNILGEGALEKFRSIVLRTNNQTYTRSSAALRIISSFRGFWRAVAILLLVPPPLRDWGYNFVAKNRYRWFGKKNTCEMPTGVDNEHYLP